MTAIKGFLILQKYLIKQLASTAIFKKKKKELGKKKTFYLCAGVVKINKLFLTLSK